LLFGAAAVVAADLGRRAFRHAQLFCPDRKPVKSWDPSDYGIPVDQVENVWFETPDGEMLFGWYCRSPRPIASAVFCHGNTGNLTTVGELMPHLLDAGFNVLLFDYRGFGRSTGIASIGGVISDGITAARFHDSIRPPELPSILYGYSLGGAIAAQVIRHHRFDALILQSTFTSIPDIARATWPRLPLHLFAGDFFDTLGVVKNLRVPLLILHGSDDEVCPNWMARQLHDACTAPKRLYTVQGGLHKDLFVRDADSLVWVINQFITGLPESKQEDSVAGPKAAAVEEIIDSVFRYVRRHFRRSPLVPKTL
jgi:pimeloyl-ACP methyl ester carboxylesterase